MAITYHAGRRIQGTSTDAVSISGGWKELGRTTLGSNGDAIDVSSLADKRYLMYLYNGIQSGDVNSWTRLNGDTGANYALRYNSDGTGESVALNTSNGCALNYSASSTSGSQQFAVSNLSNISNKEKLIMTWNCQQQGAGAGNAPKRRETVGKHVQTSNPISAVNLHNTGGGDFVSGSEVVVLGWDEDDTHTTNFWEELASVELGTTADELSSGTFTAKKYLMVQYYVKKTGTANTRWRFNNDTGSNYAARQSGNGGADGTLTAQTSIYTHADTSGNAFGTIFIVNNSANEKLGIFNEVSGVSSGAGTAPARREVVAKWSNTSSQITEIDLLNTDSGGFASGTIMKVWGSN